MNEEEDVPLPDSSGAPPRNQTPGAPQPSGHSGATVEDALEAAKRFFGEHRSLFLGVFGLYAAVLLLGSLVTTAATIATGVADLQAQLSGGSQPSDPQVVIDMMSKMAPVMLVSFVVGIVTNGFYAASFRPMHAAYFGDGSPDFVQAVGQLGGSVGRGIGAAVVYTLLMGFATMMCLLPGLVAYFFLTPYFYLVCGRQEPIGGALSTSFEWAKNNAGIIATVFVLQVMVWGVSFCVNGSISQPMTEAMGTPGMFVSTIISWLVTVGASLPTWLFLLGAMFTIEQHEA